MSFSYDNFSAYLASLSALIEKSVGIKGASLDSGWYILILSVFGLIVINFAFGRSRAISFLLSLYVSYFIFKHLPNEAFSFLPVPAWSQTLLFLAIISIIVSIIIYRTIFRSQSKKDASFFALIFIILSELALIALMVSEIVSPDIAMRPVIIFEWLKKDTVRLAVSFLPIVILFFTPSKIKRGAL